jgi:amino acid adenylation domain-containing protein
MVPLSSEQEQIWLHIMFPGGLHLYNETTALRHCGELNVAALEASLFDLRQRHEILRTTIRENNGTPYQYVGEATLLRVEAVDYSALPEVDKEQQAARLISEFARGAFDLADGPLLRAMVIRFGSSDTRIYLTIHHLIIDGVSLRQIIIPEFIELYSARIVDRTPSLPLLESPYSAYASSQPAKADLFRKESLAFWKSKLANVSPLTLPTDRPRTPQTGHSGAMRSFAFGQALSLSIRQMARRERSTIFNVVLASFVVLLARYSDTVDVTLGAAYDGRANTCLQNIVGCFVNTLLLRTDLSGDPSFEDLLARVREVTLEAMEHSQTPLQDVVRECFRRTSIGDAPVQVVFSFQPPPSELPEGWDLDLFEISNGTAKFDLYVEVEDNSGALRGRLLYNSDLFDASTIESLEQHWMTLLNAALTFPQTSIWKLPLLAPNDEEWLCKTLNQTKREIPQLCMHELFVQKAAEVPDAVAVSCQGRSLTYAQLDRLSANLAHHLVDIGFRPGSVVGLMVERSPEMCAALLGILRAGATYVPMDPNYPPARLQHMLEASGADLLLTQASLKPRLPDIKIPALNVVDCLEHTAVGTTGWSLPGVSTDSSAYIIFTSGSTGVPKGVEIPHVALTNLLFSMRLEPGIQASDVLLAVTSICFDISALELFLPLIVGARIEIATTEEAADPELLRTRIEQCNATIMQATPVSWRMLIESGWTGSHGIKILCGGEAVTENLAQQLQKCSPSVWNMYGPTETTIWSACARVKGGASPVTLGEPIANTTLYVLDSHRSLVPAGVGGELYIGGIGLAVGYCGQPAQTRERFSLVTIAHGETSRLYRTGDRVKRLRDGSLLFLGRVDRQVKLNGFRIELAEIEQVLNSLPGVQESVVTKSAHSSGGEILIGFIIPKADALLNLEELRLRMGAFLPHYMQPSKLHVLTEVPLTPNGKLDRNRMPELVSNDDVAATELPLPGTEQTLAGIWCGLLQIPSIGRRDNFFDLGGHSLLAARFIARANSTFGQTFTLTALIQAPTIAQFAPIVQGQAAPETRMAKRGSTGKQLLWIGAETWLVQLARHLRNDLTLYTLTLDSASLPRDHAACTIESLATQIVSHIREVQPHGPYLLGGYCLHGLLALEVAQQLRHGGDEIALLIIIDLHAPGLVSVGTPMQRTVKRVRSEFFHFFRLIRWPVNEWGPYLSHRWSRFRNQIMGDRNSPSPPRNLQDALEAAEPRYESTSYQGKVLFLESDEARLFQPTSSSSWRGLMDDVEVLSYKGEHEAVLREPQLGLAAEEIQRTIDRALIPALLTLPKLVAVER